MMKPLPCLALLALLALACGAQPSRESAAPARESAASGAPIADDGVAEGAELGERAPDFMLASSDGGGFRLAEHRGRPVVLVFFRGVW